MTRHGFLFDRCFPPRIARMIGQYEPVHLTRAQDDDERFQIDTPDTDIRWALVSADRRITRRPVEKAALQASGIKFFYFGKAWFGMPIHEQAWKVVRAWRAIVEAALNHKSKLFEIEGVHLKVTPVG